MLGPVDRRAYVLAVIAAMGWAAWLAQRVRPAAPVPVPAVTATHEDRTSAALRARSERHDSVDPLAHALDVAGPPSAVPVPDHVRTILVGGGGTPEQSSVSLEDDLREALDVFGAEDSIVLFGGGPATRAVQVRDPDPRGDALLVEIGEILVPRAGRDARYRPTRLALQGDATLDSVFAMTELALTRGEDPLVFYFAGHGDGGDVPADSAMALWGGDTLDVTTLASWLDERMPRRPLRIVATSCFGGGFAELAFDHADPARGPTASDRCGLFATSWDSESSGCDPEPDRARQDGFGVHFLGALRGVDRSGADRRASIDLDHDGSIGFYEALTQARVASRSIDRPITTSENLLLALAPRDGAATPFAMPEQDRVIAELGAALDLHTVEATRTRVTEVEAHVRELAQALEEISAENDESYYVMAAAALSRWPVLDDPFHPDFDATFLGERDAIDAFFHESPVVARWRSSSERLAALESTTESVELELAWLHRVELAFELRVLAAHLRARGGTLWDRYLTMRACEWGGP